VQLPPLDGSGDLPSGVHRCSLAVAIDRFGNNSARRRIVGLRLERILVLLAGCSHVVRVVVFGSFVTAKIEPNDIDVFLVMDDGFDVATVIGEARLLFDHAIAQSHFGASIFWLRQSACFPTEEEMIAGWGLKRDGTHRGIIEIERDAS
jgi:predicted nucleotidyltransferase